MLAGVGGIDAALLVVAADEGVMPQTREHLSILDLLQIPGGVVALTKVDMVEDEDWLELVEADLLEFLEGTILDGAPVIHCSARTGQGLEALVEALDNYLAASAPRRDMGRPRLPVDRVFTVPGFGTVVTGTLSDGTLATGQEVEIQPSGRQARIRGLQSHKEKIETAVPGSRVAVNLTGVGTDEIERGDVVTLPGWLRPTMLVDCQLRYLPDAPIPLKHNAAVDFFSGAAESPARVRLLGKRILAPGEEGWVQLRLDRPLALTKGDRYILRQPSPSVTIGGGVVVNPYPGRRYRRFKPEVIDKLETLAHGTPDEILLQDLERRQPREVRDLFKGTSLSRQQARDALQRLVGEKQVLLLDAAAGDDEPMPTIPDSRFVVSRSGWGALRERIEALLADYHRHFSLRLGMPREEVKSRLGRYVPDLSPRLFNEIIARATRAGWLSEAGLASDRLRLASHEVRLTAKQQSAVDRLLDAFRRAPYTTPSVAQSEEQVGSELLNALIEQGKLVKLSEDVLLLAETYQEMRDAVVAYLGENDGITVAQVRDMFDTSRKYTLALLGYMDERRITRRVGDERVLR
jgi:selenocysteine-specific elongation factor